MRTIVNATISFGMFNVPVGVAAAFTEKEKIKFSNLHATCDTPVKQPKWCPACEEQVTDLKKGFEFAKGQFVFVTEEELSSVAVDRTKVIQIHQFVPREAFDVGFSTRVDKTYWLTPNPTIPQPYAILSGAMAAREVVAVGRATTFKKEHPCILQSAPGGRMMFQTLLPVNEVVPVDFDVPEAPKKELSAACDLLDRWTTEDPYPGDLDTDIESDVALRALIQTKLAGNLWEAPEEPAPIEATTDILEALRLTMKMKSLVS